MGMVYQRDSLLWVWSIRGIACCGHGLLGGQPVTGMVY